MDNIIVENREEYLNALLSFGGVITDALFQHMPFTKSSILTTISSMKKQGLIKRKPSTKKNAAIGKSRGYIYRGKNFVPDERIVGPWEHKWEKYKYRESVQITFLPLLLLIKGFSVSGYTLSYIPNIFGGNKDLGRIKNDVMASREAKILEYLCPDLSAAKDGSFITMQELMNVYKNGGDMDFESYIYRSGCRGVFKLNGCFYFTWFGGNEMLTLYLKNERAMYSHIKKYIPGKPKILFVDLDGEMEKIFKKRSIGILNAFTFSSTEILKPIYSSLDEMFVLLSRYSAS